MRILAVVAVLAGFELVACPSDEIDQGDATTGDAAAGDGATGDGATDDGTTSTPLTASTIQSAVCARQAACCPGNESLETCQARTVVWQNFLGVAAFHVDEAALRACLDRLAAADCSEVAAWGGMVPLIDWCDTWFAGTTPNGQACGTTATGAASIVRNTFSNRECASGYCENHVCHLPRAEGEACTLAPTACESGLRCHMQVCTREQRVGDSCHDRDVCGPGTICGASSLCVEPTVVAVGQDCTGDSVCELGPGTCVCPDASGCTSRATVCGKTSRCLPQPP